MVLADGIPFVDLLWEMCPAFPFLFLNQQADFIFL